MQKAFRFLPLFLALSGTSFAASNFEVFPTVATLPERPVYHPNPDEVESVFTMPLQLLLDPQIKLTEDWDINGTMLPITYYSVGGHKVWGATAFMLSELEARLRLVLDTEQSR